MPEITKTRTTTYTITDVSTRFLTFNDTFRRIRGRVHYKGFGCFSCHKHFEDGEEIGIIFTSKGNKFVCQKCAAKIDGQLKREKAEVNPDA